MACSCGAQIVHRPRDGSGDLSRAVNRVAILWNPVNQSAQLYLDQARSAARTLGSASGAGGATAANFERAFTAMSRSVPAPSSSSRTACSFFSGPGCRSCREGAPAGDVHLREHMEVGARILRAFHGDNFRVPLVRR